MDIALPVVLVPLTTDDGDSSVVEGWTTRVSEREMVVSSTGGNEFGPSIRVGVYLAPHALPPREGRHLGTARIKEMETNSGSPRHVLEPVGSTWTCLRAPSLVGAHPRMEEIKSLLPDFAGCDYNVLICGETGTGKNLLARCIHEESHRSDEPFVRVNCAGIPETLFESLLFGHREGSFTGATQSQAGRFQAAGGGTLLLDEISEIPVHLQAKLLRVIEDGRFYPIGETQPVPVRCRVIAATNLEVEEALEEGAFREDLYHRLSELTLNLPPLRHREEDLVILAAHLLRRHTERLGKPHCQLSHDEFERLRGHHWPGNVRELDNCIKRRALTGSLDRRLVGCDSGGEGQPCPHVESLEEGKGLKQIREEAAEGVERAVIQKALQDSGGNKTRAARRLQISRRTLLRKLEKYDLDV